MRLPPLLCNSSLKRRLASLQEDNLVVFFNHSASEIDKRGGLWWEWPYKREISVVTKINKMAMHQ